LVLTERDGKKLLKEHKETLFLHKENPTEINRNAEGKGRKKNTIQKSLLQEKGLFPLAEAQKSSKLVLLHGCYIQRAGDVLLQRKGRRCWRVLGRKMGTKEGREQTHEQGWLRTRGHETGRITNGRKRFGDHIIRKSLRTLPDKEESLLASERSPQGRDLRGQAAISNQQLDQTESPAHLPRTSTRLELNWRTRSQK